MSQISRLKDAEISNGNLINADDLDAEFNALYSESNAQDTRLTDLESSNITLSGVKTFSSSPKTNGIDERTAAAGVTIDSVRLKDGMAKVSGTPTEGGEIGYSSNILRYHNGTSVIALAQAGGLPKGFINGLAPVYTSASTVTFKSGLKARDSANAADIELTGDIAVSLAGSGAAGLDTGAEASNTFYYYYLIRKSSDGTCSVVASVTNESVSGSITYPSGYDQKRQLPFAVRNDGSSNIIPFHVEAWPSRSKIMYDVGFNDARSVVTGMPTNVLQAGVGTGGTTVTCDSYIPAIAKTGIFRFDSGAPSTGGALQIRPTGRTDYDNYGFTTGVYNSGIISLGNLNSTKQVDIKTSTGTTNVTAFSVAGFVVTEVS